MRGRNPKMKMKSLEPDEIMTNYERYVEKEEGGEMYIGSVMCWGTAKKSFFTKGE